MNLQTYNHLLGDQAITRELLSPLIESLENKKFVITKGCSSNLRETIKREIQLQGWSGEIKIDASTNITITSMKVNIGLCIQTGNISRFYADMLKLQTLYIKGKIEAGIYILPTNQAARIIGDNIANFERFIKELDLYKKIITVPIHVIGIDE